MKTISTAEMNRKRKQQTVKGKISKSGNSAALILTKEIMHKSGLEIGDELFIICQDGKLSIRRNHSG